MTKRERAVLKAAMRWFRFYGGPKENRWSHAFPADRRMWLAVARLTQQKRRKP